MAATKAFMEGYLQSPAIDAEDFESFGARKIRYEILWASYENTLYRNLHTWAQAYRKSYQLYTYIRNIYNPTYRLVEFYRTMIWGGLLDADAGDSGALPIATKVDALRLALVQLWRDSNWAVNKDIVTMQGAALGDMGIRVVDDPKREQVRLELVHPSTIKSIRCENGIIKAYEIEEIREHPDNGKDVTYLETCERGEGEDVIFKTYANGKPYAWYEAGTEWSVSYGFVPLAVIQHNNVGLGWGWAESHPLRSKLNEIDDIASMLHDYVRKAVNPQWAVFGTAPPKGSGDVRATRAKATADRREPGREEMPMLYFPTGSDVKPLTTNLVQVAETAQEIQNLLQEIERDFPELQHDIWSADAISGKAMIEARQRVEAKVGQRRQCYDSVLVRCHQMAVAIGGERGYTGYGGFDLQSYKAGKLAHSIAKRPVFSTSARSELEEEKMLWETVEIATRSGIAPETVLRRRGWTDKQLEDYGVQRLAAIKAKQEDRIPKDSQ